MLREKSVGAQEVPTHRVIGRERLDREREARTLLKETITRSPDELEAYKLWREHVPQGFRHVVENHLLGKPVPPSLITKNLLPLEAEFLAGVALLLEKPDTDVGKLPYDVRVRNQLARLKDVALEEQAKSAVNIFTILGRRDVSFGLRNQWYEAQIKNRWAWLRREDQKVFQDTQGKGEALPDLVPNKQNETYTPHRGDEDQGESNEGAPEVMAKITPAYLGYYKREAYDEWNPQTLTLSRSHEKYLPLKEQNIVSETRRAYEASAEAKIWNPIEVPYGWGVDQKSLVFTEERPDAFRFVHNDDGVLGIVVQGRERAVFPYRVEIGMTTDHVGHVAPQTGQEVSRDKLPADLTQEAQKWSEKGITIHTARKIVAFIRNHLEYSLDPALEALYKRNPADYFLKIWEVKKAKCDEANVFAMRILVACGFKVRLIGGHSVQVKTGEGAAILTTQNLHAWIEVWDARKEEWVRLDATPAGDPNVDKDEQEESLCEKGGGDEENDDADKSPEIMSDEELKKGDGVGKKEEEDRGESEGGAEPERDAIEQYSREAKCTLEEAREVLALIKRLRMLRDEKGRVVYEESKKLWNQIVQTHMVQETRFKGPVPMSRGRKIHDPVRLRLDLKAGNADPMGYRERIQNEREEREMGGIEAYVLADQSLSMAERDANGVVKLDAMRDTVFMVVDSLMTNAVIARKKQANLILPLPVRVCVASTETKDARTLLLPLTESWGPEDQVKLYRVLGRVGESGTPIHRGLSVLRERILQSKSEESKTRGRFAEERWRMHRVVLAFSDGEPNDPVLELEDASPLVIDEVKRMRNDEHIPTLGFGITKGGESMKPLFAPHSEVVEKAADTANVTMRTLTRVIKEWYNIK